MRKEYHKLVRDAIPEIIRRNGHTCAVVTMSETEFQQALREKLIEEAGEAASASTEELATELADLYEVMDALLATSGLTEEQVRQVQALRRCKRGGFTQRLRLLWTEEVPSVGSAEESK